MPFTPFSHADFSDVATLRSGQPPPQPLLAKTEDLRTALGTYPEFELEFFKHRLARRPSMRGRNGLVFGQARWGEQHWFLFDVGGDQNQVQLNVGMFPTHVRVGLGFMIGRQVAPKPPAFHVFQTFIGARPPLPFRNALLEAIATYDLRLEIQGQVEPIVAASDILMRLETYHVPPNVETVFVFVGHIWDPPAAASKDAGEFRIAFNHVMPFYEELILASGGYYSQLA